MLRYRLLPVVVLTLMGLLGLFPGGAIASGTERVSVSSAEAEGNGPRSLGQ